MTIRVRTTNFDALAASAPLNRDAAVVRDGSGFRYAPLLRLPPNYVRSETPLPTREAEAAALATDSWVDLTGRTVGRQTIMGLYAVNYSDKARWVVRCSCGWYEARTARVLKSALFSTERAETFMCAGCDHTEKLKLEAKTISRGKAKPTDWVLADRKRQAVFDDAKAEIVKAALAATGTIGDADWTKLLNACDAYRALLATTAAKEPA